MSENKTRQTDADVQAFLDGLDDQRKREDSGTLVQMMREVTGMEPKMWGPSIIGFGSQHYRYESGREGDMPMIGFSPRKQNLALYVTEEFEYHAPLLQRLGKHKTAKACLYIKRLSDVNMVALRELIERSFERTTQPR
jgi:hypothetical protein